MNDSPKLSIAIPCFNEPDNVKLVLSKFKEIISRREEPIEVIVIDGCSTDNTPEILSEEFKKLDPNNFKLVLMKERGGYGHDIVEALGHATGEVLGWTHADMQTDPEDVIKAYELYLSQNSESSFIKGKRKNRRIMEALFSFGMQIVSWFMLRTYLDDINAQPKLFSKNFYKNELKGKSPSDFSLDLYALYRAKKLNYKILSFPVYFKKRLFGEAKGGGGSWKNRIKLIKRTFKYINVLRSKLT